MAANNRRRSLGSSLRDLLILIIGIVLSFTLTEWRQKNANLDEEKRIVTLLYSDLQKDTTNINANLKGLKQLKRGYDSLVAYRYNPNPDPLKILSWSYSVVNFIPFEPNRTGFVQLNNHENSGALRNKELLTSIISLYTDEYATLKTLNNTHRDVLIQQIMPRFYSWIPFIATKEDITEEAKAELIGLLKNNEFLNLLQFEYILKINLEGQYAGALSAIDSTMNLIQSEYGTDLLVNP